MASLPRAKLSPKSIPASIKKLERRLSELTPIKPAYGMDWSGTAFRLANAVNATIDDVFGAGTADAADFNVKSSWFTTWRDGLQDKGEAFNAALERTRGILGDAVKRLQE